MIGIINKLKRNPFLAAVFTLFFGPIGFLYYSWKKMIGFSIFSFFLYLLFYYLIPKYYYVYDINLGNYSTTIFIINIIFYILMITYSVIDQMEIKSLILELTETLQNIIFGPTITILNYISMPVGGIWLLILGQWKLVILGLVISFAIPYIFTLITLLMSPLSIITAYLSKRNLIVLAVICATIIILVNNLVAIFYADFISSRLLLIIEEEGINAIALLLWGHGVVTGPFCYIAMKDGPQNLASFMLLFDIEIFYIFVSVGYLFNKFEIFIPILFSIIVLSIFIQILRMADFLQLKKIGEDINTINKDKNI